MFRRTVLTLAIAGACISSGAVAQTSPDVSVQKGLARVTVLSNTPEGSAALSANYTITGGLQNGTVRQSTLLPFAEQQQLALQDAFTTGGNLAQLSDGLGTTLGAAYLARAHYLDRTHFTSISPAVAELIAYATRTSGMHSNAGKYLFANGTTNGKTPVPSDLANLVKEIDGHTDIFGRAYGLTSGTPGSDAFGDSRPFQTETSVASIVGPDYFHVTSTNGVYNRGPMMNLIDSPSYPSGHTTYGYTGAVLLAVLVPERYSEMIARGAEYGNDRILVGAHYAMDVLGGRTLALYDMAHLLANDPAYVNHASRSSGPNKDFSAMVKAATADLRAALQTACGKTVAECAHEDIGRYSDPAADEAFYASTQTYGLPVVYAKNAAAIEDVGKIAPEAGYLLTAAFPSLTLDQANQILTDTEGSGGGFLDDGSAFGVYSRINLYAASKRASALLAQRPGERTAR